MSPETEALAKKLLEQMRERLAPKPIDRGGEWKYVVVMVAVLVACLAVLTVVGYGAPIPRAKPVESLQIDPGEWTLIWSGSPAPMPLGKDGSYRWGESWVGTYSWDTKTRTFAVHEWPTTGDGTVVYAWRAILDAEGKGTVAEGGSFAGTSIRVERRIVPPPKVTD